MNLILWQALLQPAPNTLGGLRVVKKNVESARGDLLALNLVRCWCKLFSVPAEAGAYRYPWAGIILPTAILLYESVCFKRKTLPSERYGHQHHSTSLRGSHKLTFGFETVVTGCGLLDLVKVCYQASSGQNDLA
jgi:hypothetical protein